MVNYHDVLDQRSLALHKLYAQKIQTDPTLLVKAKATLARWQAQGSSSSADAEWCDILAWPLEDILAFITSDSEHATRLRQSNPFPGLLSAGERAAFRRCWREQQANYGGQIDTFDQQLTNHSRYSLDE